MQLLRYSTAKMAVLSTASVFMLFAQDAQDPTKSKSIEDLTKSQAGQQGRAAQDLAKSAQHGQKSSGFEGKWKLNSGKSQQDESPTMYVTRIITFEATPEGQKMSSQGTTKDGKTMSGEATSKATGGDAKVSGDWGGDSVSTQQDSPTVMTVTTKKGGEVVSTSRYEVSEDGRMLTVTSEGKTDAGKPYKTMEVFEKDPS